MATQNMFSQSLLLCLLFSFSVSQDTLLATQMIKDGNFLISEENTFELGFFSPGSSSYRYLGIWFHKLREQTVVWVANRNNPIHGFSGVLSINQHGNLVLYGDHEQKVRVWSTNVSVKATETCTAQLLDSGNLVLIQGRSKRIVWQSFDYPTDTIIRGMKFGLNWKNGLDWSLTSWRSADDPGTGNYSAKLDPSGSPQYFLYNGAKRHWRSVSWPWPWRALPNVRNYSFVNNQDEVYFTFFRDETSSIVRIKMDYSGLIKWSTWHESEGQWKEFWSAPKYQCDFYGNCGAYSNCYPSNGLTFECSCLPGYEPKSPKDWHLRDGLSGCVRKRLESSSVCGHGEGFVKVEHVKVPDTSAAVWVDMSMSQSDCEQECKRNCSCAAYASIPIAGKGMGCLAWYGVLIDTVNFGDESKYDLYIRVDALELAEIARKSKGFFETKGMIAILVLSSVSAWFVIIIFAYLWFSKGSKKRTTRDKKNKRSVHPMDGLSFHEDGWTENGLGGIEINPHLEFFGISAMLGATNNFSPANILGQGGFGPVYKGLLLNGQEIAVKRLSKNSRQGVEEFKNEVMLIAKLQHRNLVKLLGCCIEREEQMLVYEYLPNKSLDSFLFDEARRLFLDWGKRFNIIIGIARGILYLHQDSSLRIIHRDLKCSNILLDSEMNPKISDFGMARLFINDQIQNKTNRVVGTYGYMSPEYAVFGKFSIKSDVFSFGVILLEIISGKKSTGFNMEDASLSLIGHVWELWSEGRALELIDSSLEESYIPHEVSRCIQIGLLCVQEDAMDRPTMLVVVLMLNSEMALPSPKQPAFIFRKSSNNSNSTLGEEGPCSVNEVTMTGVVTR
ncbi:hypothetical protein P3X46_020445 [Hevea brasiliensis]|uniref:Receptor-like serine/threonine-protein kinase n=2 Tax=Hevea brasiliensis TaxID=3981 RepID=A0ABQ9LNS1_HEVBR|nr:hypothetical protein P3X46_020445 [Hevea brasiliensis]